MSERILYSSVVNENVPDHIKNLNSRLDNIMGKIERIDPYIHNLNNVDLKLVVSDIKNQLEKMKKYNKNMENVTEHLENFNDLLKPVSRLAHEKLVATEIEARTKEKERNHREKIEIATIRSKAEKITLWEAVKLNEECEKYRSNIYAIALTLFIAGVAGGFVAGMSKL